MTLEPASYPRHRFPAEIISHAVWLYHVFSLSLRDVENQPARAPASASRSRTTSSRSSMAALSQWKARRMNSPNSLSPCRARCSEMRVAGRER